jgi:Helix-turn-helix domain
MREAVFQVVRARPYLGIDDSEFCVLVSLAEHLNRDTGQCFPSAETIAFDCGRAATWEATARRVVKRLEQKRLVGVVGPYQGGRGHIRRYHLHPKLTPGLKVAAAAGKVAAQAQETWPQRPPNLRSRTLEVNLPSGSTTRVGSHEPTTPAHPYSRMRPFLEQVLAEDDGAEWVEGQGIRLESGKFLRTVQAARKYLDAPDPGSW